MAFSQSTDDIQIKRKTTKILEKWRFWGTPHSPLPYPKASSITSSLRQNSVLGEGRVDTSCWLIKLQKAYTVEYIFHYN